MTREKAVRRTVIQSLPGFWGYALLSTVLYLLIQLVALVPSLLMQRVIDVFIPQRRIREIIVYIVLFCTMPLVAAVLTTMYRYGMAIVGRKLSRKLAIRGFENLIRQPVAYYDGVNSSELADYCRNESLQYILFWMMDIPQLIATGICGIVILAYMVRIHWSFGILMVLYFPVAYFPSNCFARKVKKQIQNIISNNAAMSQIINDTFRGIKTVKSMVLEKVQVGKLNAINEKSVAIWSKVAFYDNLSGIWINDFSEALFSGASFGLASYLTVLGRMTIGSIVVVLNYCSRFLVIAKKFMTTNYDFKQQLGKYDKLFEILTMEQPQTATGEFRLEHAIRFENVTFAYTEERGDILKGLDLSIYPGEWLGIVGASGSGKTTIFDLLLRFYEPQSGRVLADGVELKQVAADSLRSQIAKVSQDTFLFPGTIRSNLLLAAPEAADDELQEVLNKVQLSRFMAQLPGGLDTEIGENGLLLSGGERQKLGLAMGLLRGCQIILLDEVTANVDRESEEELKNVLLELKQERNLTLVSISHRIEFLKDTDRIVVLKDGRIERETVYGSIVDPS